MLTPGLARRSSTSSAQICPPPTPASPQTSTAVQAAAIAPWTISAAASGPSDPMMAERTARKITDPVAMTGSSKASQSAKWVT